MKDELGHDTNYWNDAIKLLSQSLKTCQPQNRSDYTRAIIYAKRKLRRLQFAALICLMCLMAGCNTIKAIGGVTQAVGQDIVIVAEGTQERMRQ